MTQRVVVTWRKNLSTLRSATLLRLCASSARRDNFVALIQQFIGNNGERGSGRWARCPWCCRTREMFGWGGILRPDFHSAWVCRSCFARRLFRERGGDA